MADQFRTYTKFTRHTNNTKEVVNATDINKIQQAINQEEENTAIIHDNAFTSKALFSFDNNFYVNTLFIDTLDNLQYIDMPRSFNIHYSNKEGTIIVGGLSNTGNLITTPISSTNEVPMNDFVLLTDEYIPVGADIKYYVSVNDIDFYPIKANDVNKPNHFNVEYEPGAILSLKLKIELKKNLSGDSPKISAWCVMFNDPLTERSYGLMNPDLSRFEEEQLGDILLIRDRTKGDRLVKVIEPNMVTDLIYDENGTLLKVETNDGSEKLTETLIYGNYVTSQGNIETVLLQVSRKKETLTTQLGEGAFVGGNAS